MTIDLNYLYDHRGDPAARMVLRDFRLSNGERETRLGVALWMVLYADADADADADAAADDAAADDAAADDADADDADDAADDADADDADDADADDADADDADADDADAGDADDADAAAVNSRWSEILHGDIDMREGLKLIQIPGRYGYSVTLVGYMRRISGDEWEMLPGHVSVVRTSGERKLDALALDGPKRDHKCTPCKGFEEINAIRLRRAKPASEEAWGEFVAKPKDWTTP